MKKLIAAAVTAAFVAPVYAADITLSGSQEFNWQDNNGASTSEVDGTVKVSASSELPNGMSVSATIALDEAGGADGGSNLKFGGDFGSIALGDVSGAIDSIDDITDPSLEAGHGTDGTDANVLWTLPSMVPGLSVYVSASAQSQEGAGQDAEAEASGVAFQYAAGAFTVGYGTQDNDDGTSHSVVNGSFSTNGLTVAVESFTDTSATSVDTDTDAVGVQYAMGDVTLFVENVEVSSAGSTSEDLTAMGVHYSMGDVTFFAETKDDAKSDSVETTYFGASYKF